jgi:heat shock protein HslJ
MNTIKTMLLVGLSGIFTLAGCGPGAESKTTAKETFAQLAGKSWKLDRWVDAAGATQEVGAITFAVSEENRVGGNASVNRYMGQAKFTADGALDLSSGFATTMMMGPQPAMEREVRYLTALRQIRHASLEQDRLVLTGDGSLRLEFSPDAKSTQAK